MSGTLIAAAAAVLVVGIVLFAMSSKKREENGEWAGTLQWAYLLSLVGIFGLLASVMSFTAVFLIFLVVTAFLWYLHRRSVKSSVEGQDNNHLTDYMSGFFPIILVIFVLRTFVAEPFQIPSSSMRPGLVVGDFILVNKFSYGIRVPILNNVVVPTGQVSRGDVVVFNYPVNPKVNFIKRVVGLPGDTVTYKNKNLIINGKPVADIDLQKQYQYTDNIPGVGDMRIGADLYRETLDGKSFDILKMAQMPPVRTDTVFPDFPHKDNCVYDADGSGFTCKVPAGQYFMMGDNRDNSEDGRYWGFVDDRLLVGKAFLIWMNFGDFGRIGTRIR